MESQDVGCPENLRGWGLVEEAAPWGHEFEGLTCPCLSSQLSVSPLPGSPLRFCYGLLLGQTTRQRSERDLRNPEPKRTFPAFLPVDLLRCFVIVPECPSLAHSWKGAAHPIHALEGRGCFVFLAGSETYASVDLWGTTRLYCLFLLSH